ncbi:MAG: threonine synthase [Planctomycetota bacterium]|nr:MAG: threonine synthase [Planctomycetota bacterium]
MSVWDFADALPTVEPSCRVTLGEGNTPLVRSRRIGPAVGAHQLYFKLESCNPTGSFKDRFAAVAVSSMLAAGKTRCIASSSGNSGAALAAYCAAAGLACEIALVETAPDGKLLQMAAYGAVLRRIRGFGIDPDITRAACARLQDLGNASDAALQITAYRYSPTAMRGVETISHELHEAAAQVGRQFAHVFAPAGGGGLALAIARRFDQLRAGSRGVGTPSINVVQPCGNDTMATPLRLGHDRAREATCSTAVTGLQVPAVLDGDEVIAACRRVGGNGYVVSDEAIWAMQARLASEEGVFCEPAAAASVCGAVDALARREIPPDAPIVCIVTGCGFKDLISLERIARRRPCPTIELSSL